jgi:V/A-type H+-transporting ATPase subunit E
MALDKVVGDILDSAKADADKSIKSAEEEKSSILKAADESIAVKGKERDKELQDALRRLRQQEISSAELEAKRIVLNAKKEMLDKSFQATLKELKALDKDTKSELYGKIIADSKKVISNPKVYCPRGEKPLLAGKADNVIETDMDVGLVLESASGDIRLDYRFRSLLESVWEKELKNISAVLFG